MKITTEEKQFINRRRKSLSRKQITSSGNKVTADFNKAVETRSFNNDSDKNKISTQWESIEGAYFPCAKTVERIPPGIYDARQSMRGAYLQKKKFISDELLRFDDPTHNTIISEVDKFWKLKSKYDQMKFLHNRAILMYGPPGSGKSCISKIVTGDVVDKDNIVINCDDVYTLVPVLHMFRKVEETRQVLVLMEDIDTISGQNKILSLFDGEDTVNNVFYLCTTNYLDRIPERIKRPGRFDRKIVVQHPPITGRVAFLKHKLGDIPEVGILAEKTNDFSFAQLRELLIGVYCNNQSVEEVISRLKLKGAELITASVTKIPTTRKGHVRNERALAKFYRQQDIKIKKAISKRK